METDADPLSNIRGSFGNPAEYGEKRLSEPEDSRIPQENPEYQRTWTLRGSQRLNQQTVSLQGTDGDTLHIYYSFVA